MTHRHAVAEAAPIHLDTGRIEVPLYNELGWATGITLEVQVRLDLVVCWHGDRTLGVADRDRVAAWLRHPVGSLEIDDMMLSDDEGVVVVVFDGGRRHYAEPDSIAQLRAMLGVCGD